MKKATCEGYRCTKEFAVTYLGTKLCEECWLKASDAILEEKNGGE